MKQCKILLVNLSPEMIQTIAEPLQLATEVIKINDEKALGQFFENFDNPIPADIVICGSRFNLVTPDELAQFMRHHYASQPIFFMVQAGDKYHRETLEKYGFNEILLMPLDASVVRRRITPMIKTMLGDQANDFMPAKLIDLRPGDRLEFDVFIFLPMNRKFVQLFPAGEVLDEARIQRLQKHSVSVVFLPKAQKSAFQKYSVNKIKDLTNPNQAMSQTERQERLEESVRDLILKVFESAEGSPFEVGKENMEVLSEIVNDYVKSQATGSWYDNLLQVRGVNTDTYSHASRVSTYASLFAIALGIGSVAEISMAGMLHDLGVAQLPIQFDYSRPHEEWSPEQKKIYQLHPELSIKVMKDRKLVVPPNVEKIILQHHETADGSGYPNGTKGQKLMLESQLLAFADEFDYLTSIREGQRQILPEEAVKIIASKNKLSPLIMGKLQKILQKPA
ncbi:MAG: HD domain-containing protein [Bdellovibrionaceae bacterium]|nr:HD domain-containing protein [Pseudobdellovibrionaceae bacterium]